ncbi:CHAD domain-containing protein [Gimesia aquarii]|uniref:CHAD domain protein n=1 Tax=Gimesia aquarii TaxID=2527964 RepID=A0A517WUK0_9PLAN|nr:CHAD domain-containing protein [Gimesia aquarii]QDU08924.1 CHAD domain protein [Gimesia aquarii]
MGYQFKQEESLASGVQRIAQEQLSQAICELQNPKRDRHQAIHEVRKQFKKLRGLIRLVCSGLGDDFSRLNIWYSAAGRRLSRVRDAESMLESLKKLSKRFSDSGHEALFSEFERKLLIRRQNIVEEWIDLDRELEKLSEQLEEARDSVGNWKIEGAVEKIISHGLKQTYQQGAKALKKIHRHPNDELLHDCRKASKNHLYHMRLIVDFWQPVISARIVELDRLNDLLGDDHDLAVMTQLVQNEERVLETSTDIDLLLKMIKQQREELQSAAFEIADRVYAEKPKAFARRMRTYWNLWQNQRSR